ncbi:MAG TPA: class I SAM-dependent methyltransferase family protein [Candidatus Bathyarchaeia archaeon]|nr:class I SAM-dependent methyltransferase family protein [Candidatus Bathyarchaeia archaeon]
MPDAVGLKVPKTSAQEAIMLTRELALLNRELRVHRDNDSIHIPLVRKPLPIELEKLKRALPELQIAQRKFEENLGKPVTLVDILSGKLPPHVLASLPHSIDFVGDIAVVEVPPELEQYKGIIGDAILSVHERVKTVLSKWSPVTGVYRLRTFEVIGGEAKTQTVHKEHDCVFSVDLAKAYFTPRLSYEHSRVASSVREGEIVVDMFAGVGPFSIHIAKTHGKVRVYAIDVNPGAYEFLKKNIVVNRVVGKVTPVLGDARQVINERLVGVADRVVMNLPEKAIGYVDAACRALRSDGGIIHYYQFSNTPEPTETAKTRFAEAVEQSNRRLRKILGTRIVRGIAPFTYQVVIDAEVT